MNEPSDFRPGDQVELKSGGPRMLVVGIAREYGRVIVHCTWFENKAVRTGVFFPHMLKKAD